MAIFFDAPVTPDALSTFVREVPVPSGNKLTEAFPRKYYDSNRIDWAEIIRTNRTAKYRSWDGRLHVSSRDTGSEKWVNLAPLSSSLNMGEYERLQLEFARNGGTNQAALANSVYNDAQNLTNEILNRIELAWGDTLTDGILSIDEGGLVSEADYGVPANHLVNASVSWTNPAAPMLDELVAWYDIWVATNGTAPGQLKASLRIRRLMQKNLQMIGAAVGTTSGKTRLNNEELNDLLASENLPPLSETTDSVLDVDGTTTRVIADDKLLMLPSDLSTLGHTAFGVSATALELANSESADLSFEEAPGIVGVVIKDGPPFRQFTYVDAVAMPVLTDAKKLLVADVAS